MPNAVYDKETTEKERKVGGVWTLRRITPAEGRQVYINICLRVAISIRFQTPCSLPQMPGLPLYSRM